MTRIAAPPPARAERRDAAVWARRLDRIQGPAGLLAVALSIGVLAVLAASASAGATTALLAALAGFAGLGATALRHMRFDRRLAALHQGAERDQDAAWRSQDAASVYRSVVENSGDIVLRRTADGRIAFINERGRALLPHPGAVPMPGQSAPSRADPDGRNAGAEGDLRLKTATGARWFSRADAPVAIEPDAAPLIQTVLRDVTERHAAAAALQAARDAAEAANAAKSRFLAVASHEIRTPLNGILGMADLILSTPLQPEQQSYARAISESGAALLSLVDGLLDLGSIEADKLRLEPEPVAIEALIEDVVELLAPRAQAKGLELACYVAPSLPALVAVDRARLRQVLLNLAGNAVKFTATGGVSIEAVLAAPGAGSFWAESPPAMPIDRSGPGAPVLGDDALDRPDRARIRFRVRDSGIGIAPDDRARIFQPYEQADSGPHSRAAGTGLGLTIAGAIARALGGEISVESRPGQGSEFAFAIDVAVLSAAAAPPQPLAGRRVAVLAEAAVEPTLMLRRLADLGADATLLADLDSAAALLAAQPFDALLVDHRAGRPTAALLARLGAAPPAVVLIAPADRADLPALKTAGFAAHLVKPVRARSLGAVLAGLFGADAAALDPGDRPAAPAGAVPSHAAPLKVLLADDNAINAILGRAMLERLGHSVDAAADGAEAVAAFARALETGSPYDLVLMDLHMPTMDGYHAIRAIRALSVGTARVPIIALTADATAAAGLEASRAGADAAVVKPIEAGAFSTLLDRLLAANAAPPDAQPVPRNAVGS